MDLLLAALSLGFAAGIGPGPLMALLIATAIERGFAAGARVALAPLVSDLPVILLSVFVLGELPVAFLQGLGMAGGAFVIWLGVDTVRTARNAVLGPRRRETRPGGDLWRATLLNLLNPNPWLFWALVGGPLLLEGWHRQAALGAGFLSLFYLLLVGCKVVIAGIAARGRRHLAGKGYRSVLAASGLALIVLGGLMLTNGWRSLTAPPDTPPASVVGGEGG